MEAVDTIVWRVVHELCTITDGYHLERHDVRSSEVLFVYVATDMNNFCPGSAKSFAGKLCTLSGVEQGTWV